MSSGTSFRPILRFIFLTVACLAGIGSASAEIRRVSVSAAGEQGNGRSLVPSISADGHLIAFASEVNTLVDGDTNGEPDVFVKNMTTGEIRRVSATAVGVQGNGLSSGASINADGTVVAFHSLATNLVEGDTDEDADIYVKNLVTGEVRRASVSGAGEGGAGYSLFPAISADGNMVAFSSFARLAPEDTDSLEDVYVKNMTTGEITFVKASASGESEDAAQTEVAISADGKVVAFASDAVTLTPDDTNNREDVFIKNLTTGEFRRVSVSAMGAQGNERSDEPSLSADGRFIAFASEAGNLIDGENHQGSDIFVKNLTTGEVRQATTNAEGKPATGEVSYSPSLSAEGNVVAFVSNANDLVPNHTMPNEDIYVKEMSTGAIRLASSNNVGAYGNDNSTGTRLSADGRKVSFESEASNLVEGDTNDKHDIFVADTGLGGTVVPTPKLGDLNGDSAVNVQDVTYLLQCIVGMRPTGEAQKVAGDVNRSGGLSVEDAVIVLRHIVFGTPLG